MIETIKEDLCLSVLFCPLQVSFSLLKKILLLTFFVYILHLFYYPWFKKKVADLPQKSGWCVILGLLGVTATSTMMAGCSVDFFIREIAFLF